MKQLLNKSWIQVILLGIVIGGALIFLDLKFNWFGGKTKIRTVKISQAISNKSNGNEAIPA